MELDEIKVFLEAAMLAAGHPLSADQLKDLFDADSAPNKREIRAAIDALSAEYENRGVEIIEVASGYRIQVRPAMTERLHRLWAERPPRYSRALFETLALVAYRQPITRGEIEEVRGVSVSSNIVRSLLEREWIRVVGHRDVPGRPALFGTTRGFLDYFGLKNLDELPPLADLSDWESLRVQLNLPAVEEDAVAVQGADVTALPVPPAMAETDAEVSAEEDVGGDTIVQPAEEAAESEQESVAETAPGPEPVATPDSGFHEIVATEWPDPAVTVHIDSVSNEQDEQYEEEDVDATASRS